MTHSTLTVSEFSENSYLDYSMYVILDRALPQLADGLKPVQRRILYAMSELGLSASSKHKKSARTVGDVIGKFHPHGDSACYEAMVHMAQWFNYRYPLIDGQGNWGAPDDPKSFAAMRYTESKLTPYSKSLLQELGQSTVEWQPNFDGSLNEPCLLPARLPNVLLNGSTGIAVGMSTDMVPHNVNEVVDACIALLDNSRLTLDDLMEYMPGPDFPAGGDLVSTPQEIKDIYETGNGTLKVRARYNAVKQRIEILELPYQTSVMRIYDQIKVQMIEKKLPMLVDMVDESDHEAPVRLALYLRSNRVDAESVMQHLFATTDLEKTVRVNLNAIGLDGAPRVYNLKSLLAEWLTFRLSTVTRRLEHRLKQVDERLHILAGLLIAHLSIDEVIAIIRKEDEPKPVLMKRFKLTDTQAEAILNIRLRNLSKLEEVEIRAEQKELKTEQIKLNEILGSKARLKTLVKNELKEDAKTYGDKRRTRMIEVAGPAVALSASDVLPSEPVTLVLSNKGWVRVAKGHEVDGAALKYKTGDGFLQALATTSNVEAVFLAKDGKAFTAIVHELPSARGFGEPLSGRFNVGNAVGFAGVVVAQKEAECVLASSDGYGFIATASELVTKQKAGRASIKIPDGASALTPCVLPEQATLLACVSSDGRLTIFPLDELPEQAKGRGVKLISLPKKDDISLVAVAVLGDDYDLELHTDTRTMTMAPADWEQYMTSRAKRGLALPRGWRGVTAMSVVGDEE